MDEMGKELEHLRKYKIENELHRNRGESIGDLPNKYKDLQAEIKQLQEVSMAEILTCSVN